jgi:beta-glucosidase
MRSILSAIATAASLSVALFFTGSAAAQGGDTLSRIETLLRKMTLEEKVHLVHANSSFTSGGIPRLGIPELVMSDGPHGVRPEHGRDWALDNNLPDSGTYLPTGVCLAATWNPELGLAFGKVLGSEARFRGKDIILGPGINIIRSPLNGRNFEYQSEDPFLVSRMVVSYIKGVQSQGVAACVKHFAANNQENKRTLIDVHMSERAFREIYLPGFRAAVQEAGVYAVMGAYNRFRGQWASQNYYLLTQILRKEWGYRGLVMSDWNANNSTAQPFWNGLDLEMGTDLGMLPNPDYGKFFMGDTLLGLIRAGRLPEYLLDEKVRRVLYLLIRTGAMDANRMPGSYHTEQHRDVAARVAEEGMVLLRNENRFLPLDRKKIRTIAVIGANADRKQSMGGGSSQVRAFYEITPLQGIRDLCGNHIKVLYAPGYEVKRGAVANDQQIDEAVALARSADAVIYVGGSFHGYDHSVWADNAYDAEDTDKPDMYLPFGQDRLIRSLVTANPRTAVVLFGGGAVDMRAWVAQAPAILQSWYPGMEGGRVIAKILFGEVNPSGKLPITFPQKLEDHPAHKLGEYPGDLSTNTVHYFDDIYVGYRYFDTYGVSPLFPFGHGLSYTRFSYDSLRVTQSGDAVELRFTVRNTGNLRGAEVAQVYVHQEGSAIPRPDQELKGFSKVALLPGEQKELRILLGPEAFRYYNDIRNEWVSEPGNFSVRIGASSRDIRLRATLVKP